MSAELLLRGLLERLPWAVLLIDASMQVVSTNTRGRELLSAGRFVAVGTSGRLQAEREVQQSIQEVASGSTPEAILWLGGSEARRLPALVVPLSTVEQQATVLFICEPEYSSALSASALRELYQLTRAESELVVLLAQGHNTKESASLLQITYETARSHLKSILAKTNTRRQGEMLCLLLSGPARLATQQARTA